jgi:hypothetical protein
MVACTAAGVIRCPVFGSTASPPASGYDRFAQGGVAAVLVARTIPVVMK